jgi:hypothetical protein
MEYRSLDEVKNDADVIMFAPRSRPPARSLRRERLERFATVLERYDGPLNLLSRIEYLPDSERRRLRSDSSPLTIAFRDPVLREQGLAGDHLGDAIEFFDLTSGEAHHLLCDCHYGSAATSQMIAARVRSVARRMTLDEVWAKVRSVLKLPSLARS